MILTVIAAKLLHFSLTSFGVHAVIGLIGFVLSLAVSYFSYHWVEAWFLKLKDRFSFIHKQ
jgi:peptidoglycan/LPS O-acetylase OafA/YrhL